MPTPPNTLAASILPYPDFMKVPYRSPAAANTWLGTLPAVSQTHTVGHLSINYPRPVVAITQEAVTNGIDIRQF